MWGLKRIGFQWVRNLPEIHWSGPKEANAVKNKDTFRWLLVLFLFCSVSTSLGVSAAGIRKLNRTESLAYYQNRYLVKTPDDKLVDNQGNGYEKLYGVRNFRAVLNGVVYRGGANNDYNKYKIRANHNPLPPEAFPNLCKEGFGTAVYLYPTNYDKAPKITTCKSSMDQSTQKLTYLQLSPHVKDSDARAVLTMIYKKITTDSDYSPIYLHCWNGWHASGLISAFTLRQFCDFSAEQAVKYWDRNTDGANKASYHESLRQKIHAFKPDPSLRIDASIKSRICPTAKGF